jgi:hypothetical protein
MGTRKAAESAKGLRDAQKELQRQDATAHSYSPKTYKLIGSKELQKGRPKTVLQKELVTDRPHPRGSDTKNLSIFAKQIAASDGKSGAYKNPRRTEGQKLLAKG